MAERDSHLQEVLDGYARFLRDKNLALDEHQPCLVRWVREFLLFARAHAGYSFEQTLERFLAEVGGRLDCCSSDWRRSTNASSVPPASCSSFSRTACN